MKRLMSWILQSKAYQLSSRATKENEKDDPMLGNSPKFTHYYARQMGPEEVYQSLVTATQADQRGSLEEQQQKRNEWLKQFVVAYGTDDGGEANTFNGSIPQSLMMFNGELIREATSTSSGSWLDQIAKKTPSRKPRSITCLSPASDARRRRKNSKPPRPCCRLAKVRQSTCCKTCGGRSSIATNSLSNINRVSLHRPGSRRPGSRQGSESSIQR